MKTKQLSKTLLLVTMITSIQANENCYKDGVYVGINSGFLNFGGDSLQMETITKGKSTNKTTYRDIDSTPSEFKIGYQHYIGNKIEVYARRNEIGTDGGDIDVDTFGINYEFGFASISGGSKLLPYLRLGAGTGAANSNKLKKIDDSDVFEVNLGLGINYQINENIYTMFGYSHNAILFHDVKGSKDIDFEFSDTSTNTLKIGVSYHF